MFDTVHLSTEPSNGILYIWPKSIILLCIPMYYTWPLYHNNLRWKKKNKPFCNYSVNMANDKIII